MIKSLLYLVNTFQCNTKVYVLSGRISVTFPFSVLQDNCPFIANTYQQDIDNDAVGDICDNCRWDSNTFQEDTDGDGDGDVCDPDIDNDGELLHRE